MRWAWLAAAVFWVGVTAASCGVFDSEPDYFDTLTNNSTDHFLDSSTLRAVTLDGAAVDQWASAIVRYPNSLANVHGGLPIVTLRERPIAGKPFSIGWTTRPTAPFPNYRTALLVTLKPPPAAQPLPGGRGGMLMVPPDYVFKAGQVPWLTQDSGNVRFDMTFIPALAGLRVWLQLVVADSRVPSGATVSPMVELVVGTK